METAPLYSCVIPGFNTWELARTCLESLGLEDMAALYRSWRP